jgi:hypothetical protein
VDDDDVDEMLDATTGGSIPSDEWLSAWRRAWDALVTYCHTREPLHLEGTCSRGELRFGVPHEKRAA